MTEEPVSDETEQTAPATDALKSAEVDLEARVADLEAQVAEKDVALTAADETVVDLEARVADLEADPYRPVSHRGTLQYPSERVAAHEEQLYQAEVEGWERTHGQSPVQPDATGIEV